MLPYVRSWPCWLRWFWDQLIATPSPPSPPSQAWKLLINIRFSHRCSLSAAIIRNVLLRFGLSRAVAPERALSANEVIIGSMQKGQNYALINYIKPLKCFITGVIDLISPLEGSAGNCRFFWPAPVNVKRWSFFPGCIRFLHESKPSSAPVAVCLVVQNEHEFQKKKLDWLISCAS